jgi:hypothetical protein
VGVGDDCAAGYLVGVVFGAFPEKKFAAALKCEHKPPSWNQSRIFQSLRGRSQQVTEQRQNSAVITRSEEAVVEFERRAWRPPSGGLPQADGKHKKRFNVVSLTRSNKVSERPCQHSQVCIN